MEQRDIEFDEGGWQRMVRNWQNKRPRITTNLD